MAREMKDSGIAWIGEIPREWSKDKVFRLFKTIGSGTTPKSTDDSLFDGNIHWIQSGDINGTVLTDSKVSISEEAMDKFSALKQYNAPFLVVAMYGASIGNMSLSQIDGCVNQACCVMQDGTQYIQYSFYAIKAAKEYLIRKAVGGGQPNISQDTIKQLWLPLPPDNEQRRIADFLDAECARIDAVIEKTRASIEEYKKLKQSVITQAVTKGIRPGRKMKDSGIEWIGEIPEEWEVGRLQRLVAFIESGTSVNAGQDMAGAGELGVLKTSAVSKYVFLPEENKSVNKDEEDRVSCPVKGNTIIVSRMNTPELVGACGYVERDYSNLFLPDRLWQVHFNPEATVKFIYYWLRSTSIRYYYSSLAVGTSSSMQNISQDQFYHALCTIPPQTEQKEIAKYLDEKCDALDRLMEQKGLLLNELDSYKKSLIFEYVTGKKETV